MELTAPCRDHPHAQLAWPDDETICSLVLPWLHQRSWFPIKNASPSHISMSVAYRRDFTDDVREYVMRVQKDSSARTHLIYVPLCREFADVARSMVFHHRPHQPETLMVDARSCVLVDGIFHEKFWAAWAGQVNADSTFIPDRQGLHTLIRRCATPQVVVGDHSDSLVIFSEHVATSRLHAAADEMLPVNSHRGRVFPDLMVKVFRILHPGVNPDVEIPLALFNDGWDRVPEPFAFSSIRIPHATIQGSDVSQRPCPDGDDGGVRIDTAVGRLWVDDSTDGMTIMRGLAAEGDRQMAVDIAADLGQMTAQMHAELATALPTAPAWSVEEFTQRWWKRARWAVTHAPIIAERLPYLTEQASVLLDRVEASHALTQRSRIHGSYHLGQALHGDDGWFVLDFEGRPVRPLAERCEPDEPLTDVASMLRSLDHAHALSGSDDPEWLIGVRHAFLTGYATAAQAYGREVNADVLALLEAQKALTEVVTQSRENPELVEVAFDGLHRLLDPVMV